MLLLDVNVLVYAHRADLPQHQLAKRFLDSLLKGDEPFGVPQIALSALVRIVTQPVFKPPSTSAQALDFCAAIMGSPGCLLVQPGERHWTIFDRLCRSAGIRGKVVADAYLAALAIEGDSVWITSDRDFARFPGLTWRMLAEDQLRTNPR